MSQFRPFDGTIEQWNVARNVAIRDFATNKTRATLDRLFDVCIKPRGTFMDHAGDLKAIYRFAMRTGCVAQPSWRMRIGLELMFFFFNKAIGKQAVDQQYDRMLGELTSASADARTEEKHA